MKQYMLVIDWDSFYKFCNKVETAMNEGWKCQGGVAFLYDGTPRSGWAQAMICEQPEPGADHDR